MKILKAISGDMLGYNYPKLVVQKGNSSLVVSLTRLNDYDVEQLKHIRDCVRLFEDEFAVKRIEKLIKKKTLTLEND